MPGRLGGRLTEKAAWKPLPLVIGYVRQVGECHTLCGICWWTSLPAWHVGEPPVLGVSANCGAAEGIRCKAPVRIETSASIALLRRVRGAPAGEGGED